MFPRARRLVERSKATLHSLGERSAGSASGSRSSVSGSRSSVGRSAGGRSTVGNTIVTVAHAGGASILLTMDGLILLIIIVDVEAETGWVNATVAPDQKSTEHGLRQQVENAVEHSLIWKSAVITGYIGRR